MKYLPAIVLGAGFLATGFYVWWHLQGLGFDLLPEHEDRPEIVAAALIGGSGMEQIRAAAPHPDGGWVVAGRTSSPDLPADGAQEKLAGGKVDAFVARISADLSRIEWLTYFGGIGYDVAYGLAVEKSGTILIAGRTSSPDLPGTERKEGAGFQRRYAGGNAAEKPYFGGDAYVARLSRDGQQVLAVTYFGGRQDDFARHLALDPTTGRIAICGSTRSLDLPVGKPPFGGQAGGRWDGFVTVFEPDLEKLAFAAYLGGSGDDRAQGLSWTSVPAASAGGEVRPEAKDGHLAVAGWTRSSNFPLLSDGEHPDEDGWVLFLRLGGTSELIGGSRFGGQFHDSVEQGAIIWAGEELLVTGYMGRGRMDAPWRMRGRGGEADAFVARLGPDGVRAGLRMGGGENDTAFGPPARDARGRIWFVGQTFSHDFPLSPPAYRLRPPDAQAFVAVASADLSKPQHGLLFGGGKGPETARGCIAHEDQVLVWGHTDAPDFPVTEGALSPSVPHSRGRDLSDAFLVLMR